MNKIENLFSDGIIDNLRDTMEIGETAFVRQSGHEYKGSNPEEVEALLNHISEVRYADFLPFGWFFKGPEDIFFGEVGLNKGSKRFIWKLDGDIFLQFGLTKTLKFLSLSDKMMFFEDPVASFLEQDPKAKPEMDLAVELGYSPILPGVKDLEVNFSEIKLQRNEK
jgi:hypothetical protein